MEVVEGQSYSGLILLKAFLSFSLSEASPTTVKSEATLKPRILSKILP